MNEKIRKEIAAYVAANVEDYELFLQLALGRMDKYRCPFRMAADYDFYNDIVSAIEDWCFDNDVDCSEWDFEDLIEGYDGIIWEC